MVYKTKGVCSQLINFEIVDGKVTNVSFVGGCSGKNLMSLLGVLCQCAGAGFFNIVGVSADC